MSAISPVILLMMLVAVVTQIIAISLLPATRGLTQPLPVIGAIGAYLVGFVMMSRMIHAGVQLNLLIPVQTALVPMAVILIGVLAYGESASPAKLTLLIGACLLIGVANTL